MEVKLEVFTSPTCPHCPVAIKAIKEISEKYKPYFKTKLVETNVRTPKGLKRARKFGITATPSLVIHGKEEKVGIRGVPTERQLILAIYDAMKEEMPLDLKEKFSQEEGILDSIRKFFSRKNRSIT